MSKGPFQTEAIPQPDMPHGCSCLDLNIRRRRFSEGRAITQANALEFFERVERVVFQQDSQCLLNLQEASKLISAAAARLEEPSAHRLLPVHLNPLSTVETFPTLEQVERAMILAAYRKSNHKPVEAARLLGIGKTTFYRKLKGMSQIAA
jgi:transcriptional regulator of acetoin/glycerol metabolism